MKLAQQARPSRAWPLRVRLTATYTAILMVVIAALEIAGYVSVRAAMNALMDHEMTTRLAGIEDHMARHLERYGWPRTGADLSLHPAFQPGLLVIRDAAGAVLFAGEGMSGASGKGDLLRLLSVRRQIHGQAYSLVLGTDLRVASAVLQQYWVMLMVALPFLLVLSAGAGHWMSGRAMAPIRNMMAAARQIDSQNLSERLPVPATGDEVQGLAETFNGMLERIESGFQKMREFTANASHELRTPVAIVRATAEIALLKSRATSEDYRVALERVLRESERNSLLIENMLELARADTGLAIRERVWLDLSDAIRGACEQVAPLALARGIELRPPERGSRQSVWGDGEQLRRLWLILLDNAIKYTPPGGTVWAGCGSDERGQAVGEVGDTGIGISGAQTGLIFERFYRVDQARGRGMGGAGLGLAIAREIAASHEAMLEVESKTGVGSRFYVTFASTPDQDVTENVESELQTVR